MSLFWDVFKNMVEAKVQICPYQLFGSYHKPLKIQPHAKFVVAYFKNHCRASFQKPLQRFEAFEIEYLWKDFSFSSLKTLDNDLCTEHPILLPKLGQGRKLPLYQAQILNTQTLLWTKHIFSHITTFSSLTN